MHEPVITCMICACAAHCSTTRNGLSSLFNTTFTGTGALAVTAYGTPVVLNVDVPTFVDMQSAVLWSTSLQSSIRKTAKLGAVIGRGSGEAYQLALTGQGIVVVQASEGHPVPTAQ